MPAAKSSGFYGDLPTPRDKALDRLSTTEPIKQPEAPRDEKYQGRLVAQVDSKVDGVAEVGTAWMDALGSL